MDPYETQVSKHMGGTLQNLVYMRMGGTLRTPRTKLWAVSLQTPKVVDHGAANSACDQSCGEQVGENNKWLSSISTAHFIPKDKSF